MKVHQLKTDPLVFDAIRVGDKMFEIRRNDRDFRVGDILELHETKVAYVDKKADEQIEYTGDRVVRHVHYILEGPAYGVPEGYVIMSINFHPR